VTAFISFLFIRGLPCPSCIQASLSQNCLQLTIPGFPHICLPVSCDDNGLKKILGLVLAWKAGLKVPFLPLELSCPLQTILLSDLVGCENPLQIVMAFWHTILSAEGCHTRLDGQHCPLITNQGVFSGVEKHSDDINSCLF
jgi:hypothetical protein